ncbi:MULTISPECIES: TVP38/TMEM64 family protein [Gordonibacter]|uniref:TVP38/TMEM64 family membrane protein n=1 Tax=Gordonibacter faecis TaxID=3047475 RepID=A0ABT7DKG3_9ACTN|nr:VTT domain-containing protein [Gordonibacter sp. KGMB12511]MDJ1650023.1 VTT domain-containing protein [Gordonibacter sp. KGMB12511]
MSKGSAAVRPFGKRRVVGIAACAAAAITAIALAIAFGPKLWSFFSDIDAVRAWIGDRGLLAPIAMVAVVVAQIVVAVLPGEPIELAAGYLFGFWGGTALCLAGSLAGTLAVTGLVRALGMRVVRLFFTREQIEGVSWLRDSSRLEAAMFVVFLIPGTPKDVLTYAAALTDCPWWRIATITTVGRIPSVVSSTLAAGFAANGDWALAAVTLAVTVVLAVAGGLAYAALQKKARSEG